MLYGPCVSPSGPLRSKVLVCAGQQLIATYTLGSAASNPTSRFIYANYIDEPVVMLSGSQEYYYSRNQQFSITALTNATGTVVERYAYDAYGNTLVMAANGNVRTASDVDNPFTFTGRYLHPEIGLLYFRARYYSPQLGQFISRDPLGYVDGMSQYRAYFVPGAVDPEGLACQPPQHLGANFIAGRGAFINDSPRFGDSSVGNGPWGAPLIRISLCLCGWRQNGNQIQRHSRTRMIAVAATRLVGCKLSRVKRTMAGW